MELRHLRVFVELAAEQHFGRTAKRLRVAQSAISQTVRDLEDEVGARLFQRSSRLFEITPAGRALLAFANQALQAVDRGVHAARDASQGHGRLTLRCVSAALATRLPAVLARFGREHPEVVIDLQDGSSEESLASLRAGKCDVAFVSLAASKRVGAPFETRAVEIGRLGVVMAKGHPLATRRVIPAKALAGQRLLQLRREGEPDARARLDARIPGASASAIELAHVEGLLALVAANVGVAVLPAFLVRGHSAALVAVPLAEGGEVGIVAVWNRLPTAVAGQFLTRLWEPASKSS
jgi:DNA-binding transcriptional LysR family regulator